jgi:hypothetical protein
MTKMNIFNSEFGFLACQIAAAAVSEICEQGKRPDGGRSKDRNRLGLASQLLKIFIFVIGESDFCPSR